jgi:trk system potassium uptake protein TrkA
MKRFVVIGLGTFGNALAKKLKANGCRVTGLDQSADTIAELKDYLFEAVIGEATDRDVLQSLSVDKADGVIISLGEDITCSLLATLHAQEFNARHIIVKGVTADHGKLLRKLGVERIVFPETEIAMTLADKLAWPSIIDYLPIDPEYSFMEVAVPESLNQKTVNEADLKKRFDVWIVGAKDALTGKLQMFPDGSFKLTDDHMILVVGKETALRRLRESFDAN